MAAPKTATFSSYVKMALCLLWATVWTARCIKGCGFSPFHDSLQPGPIVPALAAMVGAWNLAVLIIVFAKRWRRRPKKVWPWFILLTLLLATCVWDVLRRWCGDCLDSSLPEALWQVWRFYQPAGRALCLAVSWCFAAAITSLTPHSFQLLQVTCVMEAAMWLYDTISLLVFSLRDLHADCHQEPLALAFLATGIVLFILLLARLLTLRPHRPPPPAEFRPEVIMAPLDEDDNWFDPDAENSDAQSLSSTSHSVRTPMGHDYALASGQAGEDKDGSYLPVSPDAVSSRHSSDNGLYALVPGTDGAGAGGESASTLAGPTRIERHRGSVHVVRAAEEDFDEGDEKDPLLVGSRT
eukprot:m.44392 g.44392  ORF g.44392 m.44392 type:complete len:353 (+) comp10905_c0_seq2:13-1071(+)